MTGRLSCSDVGTSRALSSKLCLPLQLGGGGRLSSSLLPCGSAWFRSNCTSRARKVLFVCATSDHRTHSVRRSNWDNITEQTRTSRRQLFTFADWAKHRSGGRFLHHMSTFPSSGVVRGVLKPVLCVVSMSALVALYCSSFAAGQLPAWVPPPPTIAIEPFQLTSFALSLLLVFRTNSSYARWEEARRKYGSIITTCRDLARQCLCWLPADRVQLRAMIGRWLCALSICTMCHLRYEKEHNLREELKDVLNQAELNLVEVSFHKPNYCMQVLTATIASSGLQQELVERADENLSELTRAIAACERILNTPIPMSYTRHTARFLIGWLTLLPWALWSYCGWTMVPISGLMSFVLLGIEEIGVYIEEPFSVLPLEKFCIKLRNMMVAFNKEHEQLQELLAPVIAERDRYGNVAGHQSPAAFATPPPPMDGITPLTPSYA